MADLIYMDVRALRYMNAWPNVGEHDAIQSVRLHTAGIVHSYKNPTRAHDNGSEMHDWKEHTSVLTSKGMAMLFYVRGQSFGYFTVGQVLDLWPLSALKSKTPKVTEFLNLFMQKFTDGDIASYVDARQEEIRFTGLTPDMEHPFTGRLVKDVLAGIELGTVDEEEQLQEIVREDVVAQALAGKPVDLSEMTPEVIGKVVEGIYGADDDDADFGEIGPAEAPDEPPQREAVPDAVCGYCEGTRLDPFEDGKPCPQCGIVGAVEHIVEKIAEAVDDEWDIA